MTIKEIKERLAELLEGLAPAIDNGGDELFGEIEDEMADLIRQLPDDPE